jgi:sugar phosphate isomerase/epimerase
VASTAGSRAEGVSGDGSNVPVSIAMGPRVIFSTSSVFPDTDLGFRLASEFGYDGVELMVNHERRSQSVEAVREMVQKYQQPVTAVHVPCLVISQPVWGWSPLGKLRRSVEMAHEVDADVVIVHPPFRWQREFKEAFRSLVNELHESDLGGIEIAVENMYSVEKFGRKVEPYLCADDPALTDFPALCLDTSHAAAARWNPIELYQMMRPRVRHIHLSDSTATRGDEHLPPGHGTLPLEELAQIMLKDGFDGDICLEVATGKLPESLRNQSALECLEWTRNVFK